MTPLARPRTYVQIYFQMPCDDAPVDRMSLRYDRLVSTSVRQTSTSRAAPPAPASSADSAWSSACAPLRIAAFSHANTCDPLANFPKSAGGVSSSCRHVAWLWWAAGATVRFCLLLLVGAIVW